MQLLQVIVAQLFIGLFRKGLFVFAPLESLHHLIQLLTLLFAYQRCILLTDHFTKLFLLLQQSVPYFLRIHHLFQLLFLLFKNGVEFSSIKTFPWKTGLLSSFCFLFSLHLLLFLSLPFLVIFLMFDQLLVGHGFLFLVYFHQLILSPSLLFLNDILEVLFFLQTKEWLFSSILLQKLCILLFFFFSSFLLHFFLGTALLIPKSQSLMPFFFHLFFKFFVLHGTFHFQRLELVIFTLFLDSYLFLFSLHSFDELLCLLCAFAQQMKPITPYFSLLLLNHTCRNTKRANHGLLSNLAFIEFLLQIQYLAFYEHVLKFNPVRWFRLRRCKFGLMLNVMYLINAFFDIVMYVEFDLAHGQVELIGKCLVIENFLLDARNETSIIMVMSAQVNLVFDEFYALFQGYSDVDWHHLLGLLKSILNHICLVDLVRIFLCLLCHFCSKASLLLLPLDNSDLLFDG